MLTIAAMAVATEYGFRKENQARGEILSNQADGIGN
jgi:hypothetical protein